MSTDAATKVLHLINGEFYAGAERVQDLLAIRLERCGFQVGFACLKDGIFAEKRQAKDAALYRFPMKSRADLPLCYQLARLVRAERYRLLHTHTPRAALLGHLVAMFARVPMVHHVHSPSERDTEDGWRTIRNSLSEKFSLRGASRLITVSSSLEEHLRRRGFAAGRICQVPNGVPICEQMRRNYAPGEELTLGMVALFRPRKGIEVLLDAMARLQRANVPSRLHAVGPFETPEYERSVLDLTRRLGLDQSVTWAGFRSDIRAEFRRMHLFVLPSLFGEGMPMVVLEAMAAGLPVVSTRVEGIPQVVRHGQDGLLAEPGDPQGLADALLRFARREASAETMGESGWRRQREHFSDLSMAAGVAAVYRDVLNSWTL
jgi:glycosyltransferase involved in cell wall biosynthesis